MQSGPGTMGNSQPFPCSKLYLIERTALNIVRGFDVKIALSRDESFIRIQWNQVSPLPS